MHQCHPPPTDAANPLTTAESATVETFAGTPDPVDADKQSAPQAATSVWTVSSHSSSLKCKCLCHHRVNVVCSVLKKLDLFHLHHHARFLAGTQERHAFPRTALSRMSWHKDSVRKQENATQNRNLLDKRHLAQLPSFQVLESARWLVATGKKKAAKKPNAEKGAPCLYCGELYSESHRVTTLDSLWRQLWEMGSCAMCRNFSSRQTFRLWNMCIRLRLCYAWLLCDCSRRNGIILAVFCRSITASSIIDICWQNSLDFGWIHCVYAFVFD